MRVFYFFGFDPLNEEGKVVGNLLTIKNTVDHVTAEQTHFYFVTSVRIDSIVLMNRLEDIGSG